MRRTLRVHIHDAHKFVYLVDVTTSWLDREAVSAEISCRLYSSSDLLTGRGDRVIETALIAITSCCCIPDYPCPGLGGGNLAL